MSTQQILGISLLCPIFLSVLGCAEQRSENTDLSLNVHRERLLYYDEENNYILCSTKGLIKEDISLDHESVLFTKIDNRNYEYNIPSPPYYANYCKELNEIIAVTIDGIISLPLGSSEIKWIFKDNDVLIRASWAFSPNNQKLVFSGLNTNSGEYYLYAVDLISENFHKFRIDDAANGIEFTDDLTIIASTEKSLINLSFLEEDNPIIHFKIKDVEGRIEVIHNKTPIFYHENKKSILFKILLNNKIDINIDSYLLFICSDNEFMYALLGDGQIIRIGVDNIIITLDKIDPEKIIGWGNINHSIWICTLDGYINIYGKDIVKIKIDLKK